MNRIVAGTRGVEEALAGAPARISVVYLDGGNDRLRDLHERARRAGVRCEPRPADELDALSPGVRHQGVVAICGDYPYLELSDLLAPAGAPKLLVALDQISDPHNFGAIVRSAVAFGADGIITLKDRAAPVTPVVVRASAGATERARIARVTNLARALQKLHDAGLSIIGLDAEGTADLRTLPLSGEGRVLVVGAEGHGLRRLTREACDHLARIDLPGPIASLNASVAAAIALYESARGRAP